MGVVFIVFVVLLLALTGALGPVIVFSGWVLVALLGLWLICWVAWRGIRSELGLVFLCFIVVWLIPQLPQVWISRFDNLLWTLLGVAALSGLTWHFGFRKLRHPQPGAIGYLDWVEHQNQSADALRKVQEEQEAQWREEDRRYEEKKCELLKKARSRGEY